MGRVQAIAHEIIAGIDDNEETAPPDVAALRRATVARAEQQELLPRQGAALA